MPDSKSGGTLKPINSTKSTKETKKSKVKLDDAYYNPETGFCGINELQRKTKKPIEAVKRFLNEQDVYTLHKPARKNFKSERVYVHNIDEQWQSDLVEMIPYAEENNDFKYLLTVIDCFSKYAWVIPLKTKTGKETASALQTIFKHRKPQKMQTDNGKEYYNKEMKLLFKESDIHHFSTYSDKKVKSPFIRLALPGSIILSTCIPSILYVALSNKNIGALFAKDTSSVSANAASSNLDSPTSMKI